MERDLTISLMSQLIQGINDRVQKIEEKKDQERIALLESENEALKERLTLLEGRVEELESSKGQTKVTFVSKL